MHMCAFPFEPKHVINDGPMNMKSKSMLFRWKPKETPSPLHPTGGGGGRFNENPKKFNEISMKIQGTPKRTPPHRGGGGGDPYPWRGGGPGPATLTRICLKFTTLFSA